MENIKLISEIAITLLPDIVLMFMLLFNKKSKYLTEEQIEEIAEKQKQKKVEKLYKKNHIKVEELNLKNEENVGY